MRRAGWHIFRHRCNSLTNHMVTTSLFLIKDNTFWLQACCCSIKPCSGEVCYRRRTKMFSTDSASYPVIPAWHRPGREGISGFHPRSERQRRGSSNCDAEVSLAVLQTQSGNTDRPRARGSSCDAIKTRPAGSRDTKHRQGLIQFVCCPLCPSIDLTQCLDYNPWFNVRPR